MTARTLQEKFSARIRRASVWERNEAGDIDGFRKFTKALGGEVQYSKRGEGTSLLLISNRGIENSDTNNKVWRVSIHDEANEAVTYVGERLKLADAMERILTLPAPHQGAKEMIKDWSSVERHLGYSAYKREKAALAAETGPANPKM